MARHLSLVTLSLLVGFVAGSGKGFEVVELSDEEKAKGLSVQVRQTSGWFTYGSTIADELDGEAEIAAAIDQEERESGKKLFRKDGNRPATWARIKVIGGPGTR